MSRSPATRRSTSSSWGSSTGQWKFRTRRPGSAEAPSSDTRFGHQAVAAYVEGLLPENPDVRAAWAAELKAGGTAFDLLAVMGWDCIGAVHFAREDTPDELAQRAADYRPVTDTEVGERLALRATGTS
ncbi:HipA N-terminal domain-containing protein [[Mycobacterium] nativiensis]|uniref:HipA N-terminal domain-containing protein n=1 Tax=[Mycobacterium] nativiensis TaxID=2855503 RepID=A0ABU5XUY0_9MYCO|nr:HipA N-terminal domain-containing protein [Mycolicibacter sp. MYC340]MEB3031794.1 HipA N-terminal domain-containing protein [Mycolicibacter sp. MYC340]